MEVQNSFKQRYKAFVFSRNILDFDKKFTNNGDTIIPCTNVIDIGCKYVKIILKKTSGTFYWLLG